MICNTMGKSCGFLLLLLSFALSSASALDASRSITDSAGRRVEIPQQIARVLAAGPPASILIYTLAPEKMVGWVRTPSPAEKAFLAENVRELPEYGRLTGRGGTAGMPPEGRQGCGHGVRPARPAQPISGRRSCRAL